MVYTFNGVDFQAFLGDVTLFAFTALNLADQSEELGTVFAGPDNGTVTVTPAAGGGSPSAANSFMHQVLKTFKPEGVEVDFEGVPLSGPAPFEVRFSDSSTVGHTAWSWDFGDGSSGSVEPNPRHVYSTPGLYSVSLLVTAGDADTFLFRNDYIQVLDSPKQWVSGSVLDETMKGIDGVTVFLEAGTTMTDASGTFLIEVPYHWFGHVTPVKEGYTFDPPSREIHDATANQPNQDFTGTQPVEILVSVSGKITYQGDGLGSVTVGFTGEGSVTTNAQGLYTINVPSGWTGAITPSRIGYVFEPPSINLANVVADLTDQDFTASELVIEPGSK
ncbi:MAG: PKD domain-containing protein [Deltaproteobacteria bacterium]|nr:PKD domain-containing protein [Deltaproteobacteria bacterium]